MRVLIQTGYIIHADDMEGAVTLRAQIDDLARDTLRDVFVIAGKTPEDLAGLFEYLGTSMLILPPPVA